MVRSSDQPVAAAADPLEQLRLPSVSAAGEIVLDGRAGDGLPEQLLDRTVDLHHPQYAPGIRQDAHHGVAHLAKTSFGRCLLQGFSGWWRQTLPVPSRQLLELTTQANV